MQKLLTIPTLPIPIRRLLKVIPDLVVGLLGIPIAFSYQTIAEEWPLEYRFIFILFLLLLYILLSSAIIDLTHEEEISNTTMWISLFRLLGIILASVSVASLSLSCKHKDVWGVILWYMGSYFSIFIALLPAVLYDKAWVRDRKLLIFGLFVAVLVGFTVLLTVLLPI